MARAATAARAAAPARKAPVRRAAAAPARKAPTRRTAGAPARKAPTRRTAGAPARKASTRGVASVRTAPAARPGRRRPAPARRSLSALRPAAAQWTKAALHARGQAALDRLLHGPALIGLVFVLLVGIVFSNVALLQKSRQITSDAARVSELKRDNATLRKDVAELGSSERIQQVAAERGLVLPAPDAVRYLRSNPPIDARNAAKRLDEDTAVAAVPTYTPPVEPAPSETADTTTGYEQTTAYTDPTAIAGTPGAVDGTTAETP
jgi:cell division protein FtsL